MTAASSGPTNSAFAQNYTVELLYDGLPEIDKGKLLDALQKRSPDVAPLDGKRDSQLLAFVHTEHGAEAAGKRNSPQAVLLPRAGGLEFATVKGSLDQSWSWPGAVEFIARGRATVALTDLMAANLPHLERLTLFENVLAAMLETYPPLAIHWTHTQQFVNPKAFLDAMMEAGGLVYTPGPINVRLFRVEKDAADGPEEFFMDTVGLAALGLRDLQCHFRGLDTQAVSRALYNTAIYLMEKGSIIEDGETVPGIKPEEKWTCYPMASISLPDRPALTLDPGPPYAASSV